MKALNRARLEPRPLRLAGTTREERDIAALVGRLPDAAPDELQVARVWRRLHAPEPGPSRAWRWASAAVLALALVIGGGRLWLSLSAPHAQVLAIEGGVFTGGAGTSWVPARRGDPVSSGALLRSDGSGQVLLAVSQVAALALGADADLSLSVLGRSTLLRLERGSVTARVTKRPRGTAFVISAGEYTVTVVGTLFSVTEAVDGRVGVSVHEGVVEVAGRGQRWRVQAGERWSSETPGRLTPSDLPAARAALLIGAVETPASAELPALFRELVRVESYVPTLTPTLAATPTSTSTSTATSTSTMAATPTVTPTPAPTFAEPPARKPHVMTSRTPERLALLDPSPPPVVLAPAPTASAPPTSTAVAPPPSRDFYAEALNLARHGEHREAANVLQQALVAGDGPRDLELYQLASLRQRHLGDPQGALEALLAYRQQYPSGALRQEVHLSIVEADLALGREEATLVESARFLAQYPGSERADELRLVRGNLLRQRGDCAGAAQEYHSVVGASVLDDATYYGAYCRRELGDVVGATAALRAYLARFPSGRHAAAAHQALDR